MGRNLIERFRSAVHAFSIEKSAPTDTLAAHAGRYFPYYVSDEYGVQMVDDLVQKRGLSVYRDMANNDDQCASCVGFLTLAPLSSGWSLSAASEQPEDVKVRDALQRNFDLMPGALLRLLQDTNEASWMSFACVEKVWGEPWQTGDFRGIQPYRRFAPLAQETVTVKVDEHGEIEPDGVWQSKPGQMVAPGLDPTWFNHFPRERFVLWAWRQQWANPLGRSVLRSAYRWYFFKDAVVRRWGRYLEKYGLPPMEGEMDGDQSAMDAAAEVLRRFQSDLVMVHKPGLKVTLHDVSTAPVMNFDTAITTANKGIAHSCFMPSNLIDQNATGSYAKGLVDQAMLLWILNNMRDLQSAEVIQAQVIRPWVDHNFGEQYECPQWSFNSFEQEDIERKARILEILTRIGIPISVAEQRDVFGVAAPQDENDALKAPTPATPTPGLPFAVPPEVQQGDAQLTEMVNEIIRARSNGDHDGVVEAIAGSRWQPRGGRLW
jgi:hypothetical protein